MTHITFSTVVLGAYDPQTQHTPREIHPAYSLVGDHPLRSQFHRIAEIIGGNVQKIEIEKGGGQTYYVRAARHDGTRGSGTYVETAAGMLGRTGIVAGVKGKAARNMEAAVRAVVKQMASGTICCYEAEPVRQDKAAVTPAPADCLELV